jgi:hypothetical protein
LRLGLAAVVIIVIGTVANIHSDGRIDWDPFRLFMVVMVGAFLYGTTIGFRKRVTKLYNENRGLQLEFLVAFDVAGIQWTSEQGSLTLPWEDVFQYKENRDFILVYTSSATFHIIPKRAFSNPANLQKFVQFLRGERILES